jgi:hypothetical protein
VPDGDAAVPKALTKTRKRAPKKATNNEADAERAASRVQQLSDFDPEPPGEVLVRLVRDAVYSRIRHRALLDVLAHGPFDAKKYHDTFRKFVRRDYRALYAKLILKAEDFTSLHGQWHEDDERHYKLFFKGQEETIEHE